MKDFVKNEDMIKLYEIYGKLLTVKQQEYFELYFFDDYSLGEISITYNVSRSAIYDALSKIEHRLNYFEEVLLIWKTSKNRTILLQELWQYKSSQTEVILKKLMAIEEEHKGVDEN